MPYINLGRERTFASAPTLDTERRAPFQYALEWTPSNIQIFGHRLSIDIPTGNLTVSINDLDYQYYGFSFGVGRTFDLQEQYMQLSYLRHYANVAPKPHWFGNWVGTYEADIDEVWHTTIPEFHISSGVGISGLFEAYGPDFGMSFKDGAR